MLIVSMGVSVDGFIADREGRFNWSEPDEEQFRFHIEQVSELGACLLGRRLYETMLPWETEPAMGADEAMTEFADVCSASPKGVFGSPRERTEGNARRAGGTVAGEVAATRAATEKDIEIGGAGLAAEAIEG